jgi:hypothetical protein
VKRAIATLRFNPLGASIGFGSSVLLTTGLVSMGCTLSWGIVAHAVKKTAMQQAIKPANNLSMFCWVSPFCSMVDDRKKKPCAIGWFTIEGTGCKKTFLLLEHCCILYHIKLKLQLLFGI